MSHKLRMDAAHSAKDGPQHPGHRLVLDREWPQIQKLIGLTHREGQVLALLFRGKTRLTVARELQIQERTVRHYVEQIHKKLEVQDRVELILRVVEVRDHLRENKSPAEYRSDSLRRAEITGKTSDSQKHPQA